MTGSQKLKSQVTPNLCGVQYNSQVLSLYVNIMDIFQTETCVYVVLYQWCRPTYWEYRLLPIYNMAATKKKTNMLALNNRINGAASSIFISVSGMEQLHLLVSFQA